MCIKIVWSYYKATAEIFRKLKCSIFKSKKVKYFGKWTKCILHLTLLNTQKNLSVTSKTGGWMPLKMSPLLLSLKRWAFNFQFQKAILFTFLIMWNNAAVYCRINLNYVLNCFIRDQQKVTQLSYQITGVQVFSVLVWVGVHISFANGWFQGKTSYMFLYFNFS